jgi:DNA-binding GntR family transcriptional regulator
MSVPERSSISEQTYQQLRSMILEQELSPGAIVTERRLAEAISISRTPLRAALNRLNGEGLVERLSNGSVVIRAVTIDELLDILYVRRLLESEAAGLAAGNMAVAALETLALTNEAFSAGRSADFDAFWQLDDRFHDAIADACGRPFLAGLIQDLRRKARMCNLRRMPATFREQGQEHAAVLAAIAAGDASTARTAMAEHLDNVRRRLVSWLGRG